MIVPVKVCSEAHELQMHTLQHLACTDTIYETMKDTQKERERDRQTQSEKKKVCVRERPKDLRTETDSD